MNRVIKGKSATQITLFLALKLLKVAQPMVILTLMRIIAKLGTPSDLYQKMAEAKAASGKRVSFTFAAFRPEILLRRQVTVDGKLLGKSTDRQLST